MNNASIGVWRGGRVRLIAHDSKSCRGHTLVGSNPTLSVINFDELHSIEPHKWLAVLFLFLSQPFTDLIVCLEGLKKGLSVL